MLYSSRSKSDSVWQPCGKQAYTDTYEYFYKQRGSWQILGKSYMQAHLLFSTSKQLFSTKNLTWSFFRAAVHSQSLTATLILYFAKTFWRFYYMFKELVCKDFQVLSNWQRRTTWGLTLFNRDFHVTAMSERKSITGSVYKWKLKSRIWEQIYRTVRPNRH